MRDKFWMNARPGQGVWIALPLLALLWAQAQAVSSLIMEPRYIGGVVVARSFVLGPNSEPIFAEFAGEGGREIRIIGEAVDELKGAKVYAASRYLEEMLAFDEFLADNAAKPELVNARLLSVDEYVDLADDQGLLDAQGNALQVLPTDLHDDVRLVFLRDASTIAHPFVNPVLYTLSFDPADFDDTLRSELESGAISVLLIDRNGRVHDKSPYNIGFRTAYFRPAGDDTSYLTDTRYDQRIFRGSSDAGSDVPWGPIDTAVLSAGIHPVQRAFTTSGGRYSLSYLIPPCPGFAYFFDHQLFVELPYTRFNPKRREPMHRYYTAVPLSDFCDRVELLLPNSGLDLIEMELNLQVERIQRASRPRQVDVRVDVMMLSGEVVFANPDESGVRYTGEEGGTEYGYTPPLFADVLHDASQDRFLPDIDPDEPDYQEFLMKNPGPDLDGDGVPDTDVSTQVIANGAEVRLVNLTRDTRDYPEGTDGPDRIYFLGDPMPPDVDGDFYPDFRIVTDFPDPLQARDRDRLNECRPDDDPGQAEQVEQETYPTRFEIVLNKRNRLEEPKYRDFICQNAFIRANLAYYYLLEQPAGPIGELPDPPPGYRYIDCDGNGEELYAEAGAPDRETRPALSGIDGGEITADFERWVDFTPDSEPRGLLRGINREDLENTDIYVYRVSNGQRLYERKGLTTAEYLAYNSVRIADNATEPDDPCADLNLEAEDNTRFNYRLMLRGPRLNDFLTGNREQYETKTNLEKEIHGRTADRIRIGDRVKVIAINRATGYMGSAEIGLERRNAEDELIINSGHFHFPLPRIEMRPPNLSIRVERDHAVTAGSTAGREVSTLVGHEGAALVSDPGLRVITDWRDHDGSALPADLPGFTARLAKVLSDGQLGEEGVTTFDIKPGRHLEVLRLPGTADALGHFYIHVAAQPKEDQPSFATGESDDDVLSTRPGRYVPVKVPFFDEEGTREAIRLDLALARSRYDGGEEPLVLEKTDPRYHWAYRPEMQYSSLDLAIEKVEIESVQNRAIGEAVTEMRVDYQLDGDGNTPLTGLDQPQDLLFLAGYVSEALADVDSGPSTARLRDIGASLGLLPQVLPENFSQFRPDDFLALQLYKASDAANALFEMSGVPLLMLDTPYQELALKRIFRRAVFEADDSDEDTPPTFDVFELLGLHMASEGGLSIKVMRPSDADALDRSQDAEVLTLIDEPSVTAGHYRFMLTYGMLADAGIERAKDRPDFILRLEATPKNVGAVGPERVVQYFPGDLVLDERSEDLGQIIKENVLIRDGRVVLGREDFSLPTGRGPPLELGRSYSSRSEDDAAVLGRGWSHTLDMKLQRVKGGASLGLHNPDEWLDEYAYRLIRSSEALDPTELEEVSVSVGGMFIRADARWNPQRGYHGTLETVDDEWVYQDKQGTRYYFDTEGHGLLDDDPEDVDPTIDPVIALNDSLYSRIGIPPAELRSRFPADAMTSRRRPAPVRRIEDPNGNTLEFEYSKDPLGPDDSVGKQALEQGVAPWRVTAVIDAGGRRLDFHYTRHKAHLRLARVTGPDELEIRYQFDQVTGQLITVTREEREERYVYAKTPDRDDHNLVEVINTLGHRQRFEYYAPDSLPGALDAQIVELEDSDVVARVLYDNASPVSLGGALSQDPEVAYRFLYHADNGIRREVVDPRGESTVHTLNAWGNPIRIEGPAGKRVDMRWSLEADERGNDMYAKTIFRGDREQTWTYDYDAKGNAILERDPTGAETVSQWHQEFGGITARTDRNGDQQSWEYDDRGNRVRHVDGLGHVTAHSYNDRGDRVATRDPRGNSTTYTYTEQGQLKSVTSPERSTTRYVYDARGRQTRETDPRGGVFEYTFDAYDNTVAETDPLGHGIQRVFDAHGNLIRETDKRGLIHIYTYDDRDRVVRIERQAGAGLTQVSAGPAGVSRPGPFGTREQVHDPNGNLIGETDWKGQITRHRYDAANRRIATTNREGDVMEWTHDGADNIVSESDYRGTTTSYEYDALDRRTRTRVSYDPGDGSSVVAEQATGYDAEGRIASETDARGHTTTFTYDALGRLLTRTDAQGQIATRSYDPNGNLVLETDESDRVTKRDYDKDNRLTRETRAFGTAEASTITVLEFDANGNPVATRDPRGNTTTKQYDALDRLTRITDAQGKDTRVVYDAGGLPIQHVDRRGHSRHRGYDALGRRVLTHFADGAVVERRFDPNGNEVEHRNGRGVRTTLTHDAEDRPLSVTEAVGDSEFERLIRYAYDANGNLTRITDARGIARHHDYNARNELILVTEAEGRPKERQRSYHYDPNGNRIRVINPRGVRTDYGYDELDRLITINQAVGSADARVISLVYDAVGNRTSLTDARGNETRWDYDALDRVIRIERDLDHENGRIITTVGVALKRYAYDAAGNPIAVTDARDHTTQIEYDALNRPSSVTYADQSRVRFAYDAEGNLTQETDETSRITTRAYDPEHRLISQTNAARETDQYRYDGEGNRTEWITPGNQTWTYEFDPHDRLSSVRSPMGHITHYDYDANDNPTGYHDAVGQHVEYGYDALNRREGHTQHRSDGPSLTTAYGYDENDNRVAVTAPDGRITEYHYDDLDRLTQADYPRGLNPGDGFALDSVQYRYDANDNPTRIEEHKRILSTGVDFVDRTDNDYDSFDRLIQQVQRGNPIDLHYDRVGNRTALITPGGATQYEYDNRDRLIRLYPGDSAQATTFTYRPDGLPERITRPNGVETVTGYTAANRIAQIQHRHAGVNRLAYTYAYDNSGNRLSQIRQLGTGTAGETHTTEYRYDADDRLTGYQTTAPDGRQRDYQYALDAVGNRLSELATERDNGPSQTLRDRNYRYDALHRLTHIEVPDDQGRPRTQIEYSYDANGNPLSRIDHDAGEAGIVSFAYDGRDRLTQAIRGPPGGAPLLLGRYDYNHLGQRVRQRGGPEGDLDSYRDGLALIEQRAPAALTTPTPAALHTHHHRGPGGALDTHALDTPGGTRYPHHDGLGGTEGLSAEDGALSTHYRLDPWGGVEDQGGEASPNRQLYTGHEYDQSTGLYYAGARYYDPDSGRFLTQDRYLGKAATPASLHRYQYAHANPTVYVDPDGYASWSKYKAAPWGGKKPANKNGSSPHGGKNASKTAGKGKAGASAGSTPAQQTQKASVGSQSPAQAARQRLSQSRGEREGTPLTRPSQGEQGPKQLSSARPGAVSAAPTSIAPAPLAERLKAFKEYKSRKGIRGKVTQAQYKRFAGAHRPKSKGETLYDERLGFGTWARKAEAGGGAKSAGKIHGHHSDPKFLGGDPKQQLTKMDEASHRALHKDMNDFLRTKADEFGNHMRPQRGNSGARIQESFSRDQCIGALCDFYRGPGAKYEDAARDFFRQHPGS